jgi:putative membrane protein
MARKPSLMSRLFLWAVGLLLGAVISVAFWDFVTSLMARNVYFGWALTGLLGNVLFCLLIFALRELMAFSRLRRVDGLKRRAVEIAGSDNLADHQGFAQTLLKFYRGRQDLEWAKSSFQDRMNDVLDGPSMAVLTEKTLMEPLDKQAKSEIEAAARQVATGTALVPLALADIVIALTVNIRMIRRIAEIYGGRTGSLGSWRLLKSVAVHLVATGAVAIGDDMLGSIAGGSIMGKLSRRFGEGVINGALTARVGVAATEVCRPMPFSALEKPSVTGMMKRALTGFFERG